MSDKSKRFANMFGAKPPERPVSPTANTDPVEKPLKTKKVSDARIVVPRIKKEKIPVKAGDIFAVPFTNIFVCAMKGSGKTTIVSNIMEKCAGANTKFIIIGNTIELDPTLVATIKKFRKRGHHVTTLTDIVDSDTGVNEIQEFIDKHKSVKPLDSDEDVSDHSGEEEDQPAPPPPPPPVVKPAAVQSKAPAPSGFPVRQRTLAQFQILNSKPAQPTQPAQQQSIANSPDVPSPPKRKRKPSKIYPEYIIVLDDLGNSLRDKPLTQLMKTNRHFKTLIIVSTQHLNDLLPDALRQIGYCMLFSKFSDEKLVEVHKKLAIPLPLDRFRQLYKDATKDKFGFLFIGRAGATEFRKGFTEQYII